MMTAHEKRIRKDVEVLSGIRPYRNFKNLASLKFVAGYIKDEFAACGLVCEEQKWMADGNEYKNIIATYNPLEKNRLVVGAHYDVAGDQPGADDNASGIAGLLETARLIAENKPELDYRIDFVAYCLEEPPFFGKKEMGSYVHAESLKKSHIDVLGMICYEMIGYFSDAAGSQPNPKPELASDFPDTGNFITVVGINRFKDFSSKVHQLMSENDGIQTLMINFPANDDLASLSDHRNYWQMGYPAVMITDTATVRNGANYHSITDTIDTLDFDRMTEVVNSSYNAIIKIS